MYNWQLQQQINLIHDRFHYNRAALTPEQIAHPEYYIDHSCTICYPLNPNPDQRYTAFWNWYRNNTSAYSSTRKTLESFNRLLHPNNIDLQLELHYLLYTTRFYQIENANTLIPLIVNCLNYTRNFTRNLDRLNLLQNIADNDFDTSDEENNDPLEDLLDDMQNNQNANQLLNLIERIANDQSKKNIMPLPTFSGGDQDPLEWLEEFERCAEINGYEVVDMLDIVRGYLLNESRSWFDQIDGHNTTRFQSWSNPGNRNFRQAFITRFRNPGKLLQWRMELNNRLQRPHETIHQYAQDIRKLIKKTGTNAAMPESEKVFHFTKGLRREIAAQVTSQLSFQPNATFEQVVESASQVERHGQMYPETLVGFYGQINNMGNQVPNNQYPLTNQSVMNNYSQSNASNNSNVNDTLNAILQALGSLNLNQNSAPVNNNSNYTQNNSKPRQPRGPVTCYKCKQLGHIARNCPVVQPNNVVNPNPQPTVQAFAQQVPFQPVTMQPQVQQQYVPMVPVQNYQPQQQQVNNNNNNPVQQNNNGNVFVTTQQQQQPQQPQVQMYIPQHLNENTHL